MSLTPMTVVLLLGCGIAFSLSGYAIFGKTLPYRWPFAALMAVTASWILGQYLTSFGADNNLILLGYNLTFIRFAIVPILTALVLQLYPIRSSKKYILGGVATGFAGVALALAFTNVFHQSLYTVILSNDTSGSVRFQYKIGYFILIGIQLTLITGMMLAVVLSYGAEVPTSKARLAKMIVLSAGLVAAVNLITTFEFLPINPQIELSPYVLVLLGGGYVVYQSRFLNRISLGLKRSQSFENLPLGVVMVNRQGLLIDANKMACEWFKADRFNGLPVNEFFAAIQLPDLNTLQSTQPELFSWQNQSYELTIQPLNPSIASQAVLLTFRDVTETQKTYTALAEKEALYRTIVEHQTDLICRYKPDGTITFVNWAFVRLADNDNLSTPEDFIGLNFFDFFEPEACQMLKNELPRLSPARPFVVSERAISFRTSYIFQWVDYGLFKPGIASATIYQSVGQDITRLKVIENQLQKSEDRFRQLLDSQRDVVFRTSLWGELTYVNRAFCETFGVTEQEALGKPVRFFALPPDMPDDETIFNQLRYPPFRFRQVIRVVSAESIRWIDIEAYLIEDAQGRWKEIQAVGRDVTERIKREEVENRFVNLATNFPDLILILDAKTTNLLYTNLETFLGYTVSDLQFPGSIGVVVHPEDQPSVYAAWEALLNADANQTITTEFRVVDPRAQPTTWMWIQSRGRLLYDQPNAPRLLFSFSSIEQQKETERALRQALAVAERANRTRTEFLASMSHEIRTPMNAVIGTTSLLLSTPLNDEQRDYVQTIQSSGELLLALVNNILDYFKFHNEHVKIESIPTDVLKIAEDIIRLLGSKARERGLELIMRLEPSVPALIASDPLRLQQVLVNLIDNAIKFTEQGIVKLTVWYELEQLFISVSDTGIGIPDDKLDVLFKPFSQVESGSKRVYGGTGLGLAICKTLIQRMGGEITVESTPGVGSTFSFFVPAPLILPMPPVPSHLEPLKGKHVLLIDSDPKKRSAIQDVFYSHNISVEAIENYNQVQQSKRHTPPDFIVISGDHNPQEVKLVMEHLAEHYPTVPQFVLYLAEDSPPAKNLPKVACQFLPRPFNSLRLLQSMADTLNQTPSPPSDSTTIHQTAGFITPDLRILIAEDNPINQKMLTKILEKLGYKAVQVVNNGAEALKILQNAVFDVVFMDVQMPVMDGFEATRQIRATLNYPIKIVALTADMFNADRDQCLAAGMNDFIAKPVRMTQIKEVLSKITTSPAS